MSKRLDGTSMFTGVNAGFTNAFAQLSGQYADGITLIQILIIINTEVPLLHICQLILTTLTLTEME